MQLLEILPLIGVLGACAVVIYTMLHLAALIASLTRLSHTLVDWLEADYAEEPSDGEP